MNLQSLRKSLANHDAEIQGLTSKQSQTNINHHKRNLFLSFFSTNAFFEKHTWSSKILHPVFEARPDSDPETAAWMVPYLRSASGLFRSKGSRVRAKNDGNMGPCFGEIASSLSWWSFPTSQKLQVFYTKRWGVS